MSGRAIAAGMGVTRCTQYDESRGVSTGTGIMQAPEPRTVGVAVIISP